MPDYQPNDFASQTTITVSNALGMPAKCARCSGRGKLGMFVTHPCPDCNGTGFEPNKIFTGTTPIPTTNIPRLFSAASAKADKKERQKKLRLKLTLKKKKPVKLVKYDEAPPEAIKPEFE